MMRYSGGGQMGNWEMKNSEGNGSLTWVKPCSSWALLSETGTLGCSWVTRSHFELWGHSPSRGLCETGLSPVIPASAEL